MTLHGRIALLLGGALLGTAGLAAMLGRTMSWPLATLLAVIVGFALALPAAWLALRPLRQAMRAVECMVSRSRDGDFGFSLLTQGRHEISTIIEACNELGHVVRQQRAKLVEREALLDTAIQSSPMALVLVDSAGCVVYENVAARHLLAEGTSLHGLQFEAILSAVPAPLREAAQSGADSLFSVEIGGEEETFQLSVREFVLGGRSHRLYLFRRLTRELSRREVAAWKKLIRVVSHELNNTLGPIASLADSGAELTRRADLDGLLEVFAAIAERADHLSEFIGGYAAVARLPAPLPKAVRWETFLLPLARQYGFTVVEPLPARPGWFDDAQVERLLINLVRNAQEAGGPADAVEVAVYEAGVQQIVEVRDRGPGMSDAVLAQALLPFYSTKRSGTGLGLAISREIAEAHGGWIRIGNRDGGGACVTIGLPVSTAAAGGFAAPPGEAAARPLNAHDTRD